MRIAALSRTLGDFRLALCPKATVEKTRNKMMTHALQSYAVQLLTAQLVCIHDNNNVYIYMLTQDINGLWRYLNGMAIYTDIGIQW